MSPRSVTLEPKAREDLLAALRAGNNRVVAARYAGLDSERLTVLLIESPGLLEAVQSAEAAAEISHVASIAKAAKAGDWRAASFLLDRRPPVRRSPPGHCGSHTKQCKVCDRAWTLCPHAHETKGCQITSHLCNNAKGFGTDHLGSAHCKLHGGSSPNGAKHAAAERATQAAELLGIPLGNGDPFDLLTSAVQHAQSQLHGSAALVREALEIEEGAKSQLDLAAALDFQTEAIRSAFRGGKAVVDANVAERGAILEDAAFEMLNAFLRELLERVPTEARPQLQAWASQRLVALGTSAPVVH